MWRKTVLVVLGGLRGKDSGRRVGRCCASTAYTGPHRALRGGWLCAPPQEARLLHRPQVDPPGRSARRGGRRRACPSMSTRDSRARTPLRPASSRAACATAERPLLFGGAGTRTEQGTTAPPLPAETARSACSSPLAVSSPLAANQTVPRSSQTASRARRPPGASGGMRWCGVRLRHPDPVGVGVSVRPAAPSAARRR